MSEVTLKQVDVFSTKAFSGYPAVVATNAAGVSIDDMRRIAAEIYTLETTFVVPPEDPENDFRILFFTPTTQLAFSGHAMLGTCYAAAEDGLLDLKEGVTTFKVETGVGVMPVDYHIASPPSPGGAEVTPDSIPIMANGSRLTLNQIMLHRMVSEFDPADLESEDIENILGLDPGEIKRTGLPVRIIYSGLWQLIIPVYSQSALLEMHPDLIKLKLMNNRLGVNTTDLFTLEPIHDECVCFSRHFSPAMGMWEDLGSGAGASSIGAYLVKHGVRESGSMIMEQGQDREKLSRVHVRAEENPDGSVAVQMGGLAVTAMSRTAEINENAVTIV